MRPQASGHRETIVARHVGIEDHDVAGLRLQCLIEGGRISPHENDLEAEPFQAQRQFVTKILVVFQKPYAQ